jgi:uncharacterized protein DUF6174
MIRHAIRAALGVLVLAACGDATGPLDELLANRGKWLGHAIPSYTIDASRYCFCPQIWPQPVRLRVVDGVIVEGVVVATGDTLTPAELATSGYRTVDDLFDVVLDALARHAATLQVTYDAELGYPLEIAIDYDLRAVDEEITFRAANVAPLLQ